MVTRIEDARYEKLKDVLKFGTYEYFTENTFHLHYTLRLMLPDPGDSAAKGVGLVLLACLDCGFESRRGHVCLFFVSVVSYRVQVSASG
jgi:hypothetical protein